jgi:hypothetical protein
MTSSCRQLWLMALIVFALSHPAASAQNDAVSLQLDERWSNVESGKELTLHLRCTSREPFQGRLTWAFAVGAATVRRGEASVDIAGGQSKVVAITAPGQSVRPGIILETTFAALAVKDKDTQASSNLRRAFWIFPADPFADRRDWAKGLRAHLYDPKGGAAEVLKKVDFPTQVHRNLAALEEIKAGVLIIGEGLSWRDEEGLGEVAWRLAERGVRVLCLAPADGLALPAFSKKLGKNMTQLSLRKSDIITAWDKRLDADRWSGNVPAIIGGIGFQADEGEFVGAARAAGDGWPWVEVRFGETGGALAICGFGVIRHWDASPTPRFVFLRALQTLTDKGISRD